MDGHAWVLTVTASPALDVTYVLNELAPGEINRAQAMYVHPGGKGVNVARALVAGGVDARALMPVGGAAGDTLVRLLGEQYVPALALPVRGLTRTNVTLTDRLGATTKVNAPPTALRPADADTLVREIRMQLAARPRWLVVAGAIPPSCGQDFVARLASTAVLYGVHVALDTWGAALHQGLAAGHVALMKPNLDELAGLSGTTLHTVGDVVRAARPFLTQGSVPDAAALVTLGAAGALLVTREEHWWAGGPPLVAASTVGAGDVTLAGYLAAQLSDAALPDRLVTAVAWGRAAVQLPGSGVPSPADIDPSAVRLVPHPPLHLPVAHLATHPH